MHSWALQWRRCPQHHVMQVHWKLPGQFSWWEHWHKEFNPSASAATIKDMPKSLLWWYFSDLYCAAGKFLQACLWCLQWVYGTEGHVWWQKCTSRASILVLDLLSDDALWLIQYPVVPAQGLWVPGRMRLPALERLLSPHRSYKYQGGCYACQLDF